MDYSVCNCQFCARVVPTGSPTFMMYDNPFCSVLCRDWFVRRYHSIISTEFVTRVTHRYI